MYKVLINFYNSLSALQIIVLQYSAVAIKHYRICNLNFTTNIFRGQLRRQIIALEKTKLDGILQQ